MKHAVMIARDILAMHARIEELEWEVAELREYKRKYDELLDGSLRHGEQMMGGWLRLLTDPKSPISFKQEEVGQGDR